MGNFLKFQFIKATLVCASGHWYCLYLNLVTWGRNSVTQESGVWGYRPGDQGYTHSLWHSACTSCTFVFLPFRHLIKEGRNGVLLQFSPVVLEQDSLQKLLWLP